MNCLGAVILVLPIYFKIKRSLSVYSSCLRFASLSERKSGLEGYILSNLFVNLSYRSIVIR